MRGRRYRGRDECGAVSFFSLIRSGGLLVRCYVKSVVHQERRTTRKPVHAGQVDGAPTDPHSHRSCCCTRVKSRRCRTPYCCCRTPTHNCNMATHQSNTASITPTLKQYCRRNDITKLRQCNVRFREAHHIEKVQHQTGSLVRVRVRD